MFIIHISGKKNIYGHILYIIIYNYIKLYMKHFSPGIFSKNLEIISINHLFSIYISSLIGEI